MQFSHNISVRLLLKNWSVILFCESGMIAFCVTASNYMNTYNETTKFDKKYKLLSIQFIKAAF